MLVGLSTAKITFGGEPVEYGLMPVAHTDGDIFVHFMQSNILLVGDVVISAVKPKVHAHCPFPSPIAYCVTSLPRRA